jgi:hypothetical protein
MFRDRARALLLIQLPRSVDFKRATPGMLMDSQLCNKPQCRDSGFVQSRESPNRRIGITAPRQRRCFTRLTPMRATLPTLRPAGRESTDWYGAFRFFFSFPGAGAWS